MKLDKNAPLNGDEKFLYSITFTENDNSGISKKQSLSSIGNILIDANKLFIYMPVSFGVWESTISGGKNFQLHLQNEDGTPISDEHNDFITFLLSNGKFNQDQFEEFSLGGVLLGTVLVVGVGSLVWCYFGDKESESEEYADGGELADEISYIERRIDNLQDMHDVANEDEQPYLQSQIDKLKKEKDNLLNKKDKAETPRKKIFGLFEKGGEANFIEYSYDELLREYDKIGALLDDSEIEEEKDKLRKELAKIEDEISKHERPE